MQIVLATSNPNKVEEINAITQKSGIEFILPPNDFNPIENGKTFEENSFIKAKEANRLTGMMTLADDSGLCVDALNDEPGIYSARYAETPAKRIEKLLKNLENVEDRSARFKCAMTLISPEGELLFSTVGVCEGEIAYDVKGQNGFGYDPVFVVAGKNMTMAELSEEDKNKISHRAVALEKVMNFLCK